MFEKLPKRLCKTKTFYRDTELFLMTLVNWTAVTMRAAVMMREGRP